MIETQGAQMATEDWTQQDDPKVNADTLGTMIKSALIQSASLVEALQGIHRALTEGDAEDALRRTNNALVGVHHSVFTDFKGAWYQAIPRHPEGVSYG